MTVNALQNVIFTLQYCLETFEQTCQCGICDPCRRGQQEIRTSIQTMENFVAGMRGANA